MNTTLLLTGLACVIAAAIGGGLKAFGIEIPVLLSVKRQLILAGLGIALIVTPSIRPLTHTESTPSPTQSDSTPSPAQSDSSSWNADPRDWPYREEITLYEDHKILFHGLVLNLDEVEEIDPANPERNRAHVSGELDGNSFSGEYRANEKLTASNERCEFSITFVSVVKFSTHTNDRAHVVAHGNCKE